MRKSGGAVTKASIKQSVRDAPVRRKRRTAEDIPDFISEAMKHLTPQCGACGTITSVSPMRCLHDGLDGTRCALPSFHCSECDEYSHHKSVAVHREYQR